MRKRSIAFKLGLYFSLALLAFALVAGSVFFLLFKKQNITLTQKQLEDRAAAIANTFGTFISAEGSGGGKHGEGNRGSGTGSGGGNGLGYAAYIRFLDDIAMADVWVVDADHNLVTPTTHEGHLAPASTYNYADLPADAETVVDQAFGGQVTASEGFSGLLNTPTLTVGAPVRDSSGNIQAVVLLHSPVEGIESAANEGFRTLAISLCVALVIGIGFAVLLARSFTKPMKEMQVMAGRLAGGDYTAASHIERQDEIGQLAGSLDTLSHQLKLSSEEHERFQKMQQTFFSNISHELKTPIALIQGYAEGLKEGVSDDPESMQFYCDVIIDEADKMNQMVKNLMTLNQLEFGDQDVQFERFDLTELIKGVLQSMEILIQQKDAKIQFRTKEPVYVWADEFKAEQVLRNYVNNALNHLDGDKVIDIKILCHDEKAKVTVFNTGIPIPEDDLPHIWEKFYKVDKAHTREYGGNGIGLSIVKAIMDSFHQEYGVNNYDNGVEFWFELDRK